MKRYTSNQSPESALNKYSKGELQHKNEIHFNQDTRKNRNVIPVIIVLTLSVILLGSCYGPVYVSNRPAVVHREVVPPTWAPVYDNVPDVRYYYLPDIEVYYDVWDREFICLHDGNWIYTATLPGYYGDFDINTSFVVILDAHVNEPWRHHQTYISHYPRYYYRSAYHDGGHNTTVINNNTTVINNYGNMRGFNENARNVIYNNPRQDGTTNTRYTRTGNNSNNSINNNQQTPNNNQNNNSGRTSVTNRRRSENNSSYNTNANTNSGNNHADNNRRSPSENVNQDKRNNSNPPVNMNDKPVETRRNAEAPVEHHDTAPVTPQNENSRRSEPAVYKGKEVGQPVRVTRDMMAPKESSRRESQSSTKQEQKSNQNNSSRQSEDSGNSRRRR